MLLALLMFTALYFPVALLGQRLARTGGWGHCNQECQGLGSLGGSSRTGLPQTPSCGLGNKNTRPRNGMPLSIKPLKPDHLG